MGTPSYVMEKCLERKQNGESAKDILPFYIKETGRQCSPKALSNRMRDWEKASLLQQVNVERLWLLDEDKKPKKRIIGVIGDTHFPFVHPKYLSFLIETFVKWGVTDIVHIGDAVDNHFISHYDSEVDALNDDDELEQAISCWQEYAKVFPNMHVTMGTHDTRAYDHKKMSKRRFKDYNDMYEIPKTIKMVYSVILNGVFFQHGTRHGINAHRQNALDNLMSSAQGHAHSNHSIQYLKTRSGKKIFGLCVGCGIDYQAMESYAFRYGHKIPAKPILGCGVVISDKEAYAIPMDI